MLNLDEIYNQEKFTKKLIEESNKKVQAETKDRIIKNLKKMGIEDEDIYSAIYEA